MQVDRLHADRHSPLWREQFDHCDKDFLLSLHHSSRNFLITSLQAKSWTKAQKWWEVFGKYWLISNHHNNDDVKLMNWLMNGENHGTIDTCGENVSSMPPLNDAKGGIRLLKGGGIDNHSKLLKMELGQQIPIKSPYKMKKDVIKRVRANHGDYYSGPVTLIILVGIIETR